jgi:predicted nucleic-acid-binding protein
MIGLDTNVLLRYLTQDHPAQSALAASFIENDLAIDAPGFVSGIVLAELIWVLQSRYGANRAALSDMIARLLSTDVIAVERAECVARAAERYRNSRADFADCLIVETAMETGCTSVVTFDKAFAKLEGARELV